MQGILTVHERGNYVCRNNMLQQPQAPAGRLASAFHSSLFSASSLFIFFYNSKNYRFKGFEMLLFNLFLSGKKTATWFVPKLTTQILRP